MAWRLADWVIRGECDNRQRNGVVGSLWLAGRTEPVRLELTGNPWRDLAGCRLRFRRRSEVAPARPAAGRATFAPVQRGVVGDMTASRRVKLPAISDAELEERLRLGLGFPTFLANGLYLEWFSSANGRVVFETTDFALHLSESAWIMTAEQEQRQRMANRRALGDFLRGLRSESTEGWEDPDGLP